MNQAVNFFWTIMCFIPVVAYWILPGTFPWYFLFLILSLISLLLPAQMLQLSNNRGFYEHLGVKFIRKFVQNGDYVNRFTRKTKPAHRVVKKANPARYLKAVMMYERYHFFCFVFFLATSLHAAIKAHFMLFILISLANIVYNICPMLLQQYNSTRLAKFAKRGLK